MDTVLVSTRSLSLTISHLHFLVFSHQGTFPRLYSCSAPDNIGWISINYDPIQVPDASQTFTPRNALQGRQTRSAPKFGFFFRFCVKRQIVFSPSVACGISSNTLDGRTLRRQEYAFCVCNDVSGLEILPCKGRRVEMQQGRRVKGRRAVAVNDQPEARHTGKVAHPLPVCIEQVFRILEIDLQAQHLMNIGGRKDLFLYVLST